MKLKIVFFTVSSALVCIHATSAHAMTTFVGSGFFVDETPQCAPASHPVGQVFTVIYRPPSSSTSNDGLVLRYASGFTTIDPEGGHLLNGKTTILSLDVNAMAAITPSTNNGSSDLKIVVAPNNFSLTLVGTLTGLYGISACTVRIQAAATRRTLN